MKKTFLVSVILCFAAPAKADPYTPPPHAFNDCHARIINGPDIYWTPRAGNDCDYDDAPNLTEAAKNAGLGSSYCVDMNPEEPPDTDMGAMFCNF